MRRLVVGAMCALLLTLCVPGAQAAPKLELSISNFRFCAAEACTPLDTGYVRTDMGALGPDLPLGTITVKRGTTVVWVYRDGFCDTIGCSGHNVVFEDGSLQGKRKGFTPSGQGEKKISVRITQKAGTTIRYFCSVNNHYQEGMTGVLSVVK